MKLVPNAYIKKKNNVTTEIDLIGIHKTGIYVFESKNYGGWIFGNGNSKYWMQTFKTGHKNKFFNPIWQNNGHINALSYYLRDLDIDNSFKSIIVFGQSSTLKKISNIKENVIVFKRFFLKSKIKQCILNSNFILTEKQVYEIYKKIELCSYVDKEVKKNHIKYIKKRYK